MSSNDFRKYIVRVCFVCLSEWQNLITANGLLYSSNSHSKQKKGRKNSNLVFVESGIEILKFSILELCCIKYHHH